MTEPPHQREGERRHGGASLYSGMSTCCPPLKNGYEMRFGNDRPWRSRLTAVGLPAGNLVYAPCTIEGLHHRRLTSDNSSLTTLERDQEAPGQGR